jgi:hypothetical protein
MQLPPLPRCVTACGGGSYVLVVAAYVVGGVAWNVHKGATLGVEALPHLDFWRQVPDLVKVRCVFVCVCVSACV